MPTVVNRVVIWSSCCVSFPRTGDHETLGDWAPAMRPPRSSHGLGGLLARASRFVSSSQRLQVLHEIVLLLVGQVEPEARIVALHDVEQRLEPTVVVEAALVLGLHEEPTLADEDAGQVHGAVGVIG